MLPKALILSVLLLLCITLTAQTYTPVTVTGYNHDVVAEGSGTSSLATTTKEMDAITPSNFVICTKQFATANGLTPANTYGLPDNGSIVSGTKTYQLASYAANNALYLLTSETGTLTVTTPAQYSNISLLTTATEGAANVSVVFNFTDGTIYNPGVQTFSDWFDGTTGLILQGFGRIKRKAGPFSSGADYEAAPNNPRFYSKEFTLPCGKTLASITLKNTTGTAVTASNRAFIMAVSGAASAALVNPVLNGVSFCNTGARSTTLTVQNPQTGLTYRWYTIPTGGTIINTGVSYITPALTITTTYYVEAVNSAGCTTTPRTPVTVTFNPLPAAPVVPGASVCSGSTASLAVTAPDAALTYNWYTTATGGTAVATAASYTTPAVTGTIIYYADATNASGCTSSPRTAITVNVNPAPAAPTATGANICSGSTAQLVVNNPDATTTYGWFSTVTGGTALSSGNSFTSPALTGNTTYYLEATNTAGCKSAPRTAVAVTVTPAPAAPAAAGASICSGSTTTLAVTNPATGVTYSWYTAATGGTAVNSTATFVTPALTGSTIYYVEATSGTCKSTRTAVPVTILGLLPAPVITVGTVTASSATFNWQAVAGATGYQVSVNGGSFQNPSTGATGLSHTATGLNPLQQVTITVRALGAQACQNSNANATATTLTGDIFIPNVFTPNADGRNDVFKIYGTIIAGIDMQIFNQWGEMLIRVKDLSTGWDGTYKGRQQPAGVYVYAVRITLNDGSEVVRKGEINLVR